MKSQQINEAGPEVDEMQRRFYFDNIGRFICIPLRCVTMGWKGNKDRCFNFAT